MITAICFLFFGVISFFIGWSCACLCGASKLSAYDEERLVDDMEKAWVLEEPEMGW